MKEFPFFKFFLSDLSTSCFIFCAYICNHTLQNENLTHTEPNVIAILSLIRFSFVRLLQSIYRVSVVYTRKWKVRNLRFGLQLRLNFSKSFTFTYTYVHTPTVIICKNALMILYTGSGYVTEVYATGLHMWTRTRHQPLFK